MKKVQKFETVRVLSVRQPWASLIVTGIKDVENRTWSTPYRGTIYIHASQRFDNDAMDYLVEYGEAIFGDAAQEVLESLVHHPRGALLGRVTLSDIIPFEEENLDQLSPWHFEGNLGWYLENAEMFEEPIPMNGKLGLFSIELDTSRIRIITDEDEN